MDNIYSWLVGDEDADELAALQSLVDSGDAWKLEGSVGREAMRAIEAGLIALGDVPRVDFWGTYVPSRYEVVPGSVGSVEYVEAHGGRVPS